MKVKSTPHWRSFESLSQSCDDFFFSHWGCFENFLKTFQQYPFLVQSFSGLQLELVMLPSPLRISEFVKYSMMLTICFNLRTACVSLKVVKKLSISQKF